MCKINMSSMIARVGIGVVLICGLVGFCGCGETGSAQVEAVFDGVTYSLSSDWQIDEEERAISNEEGEIYYTVENDIIDKCSSIEERKALYTQDGYDGIDTRETEVNGTEALITEEPVNEIYHCEIYFYADGEEHEIWFEPDFGRIDDTEPYTEELLKGISW